MTASNLGSMNSEDIASTEGAEDIASAGGAEDIEAVGGAKAVEGVEVFEVEVPERAHFPFICLIHYHEVGLKGKNRSSFESRLKKNIEKNLADIDGVRVSRMSGRLLASVKSWDEACEVAEIAAHVPGVVRVSCGVRTAQRLEDVYEAACQTLERCEPYQSFKVDARRANTNFPIDSMRLNQLIGAWLHERLSKKLIKMKEPDVKLHVEMVEGSALIYAHTRKAVGGLPVGSAGSVVCLLSAGLDSPVAAWRMMKRGATVTALHFSGRPETGADSEYLVQEIIEVLSPLAGIERLCIVAFGSYQRLIADAVPPELRVIFYRRLMFAVANRVAQRFGARALVTGESLGQVASQTLDNIRATDAVASYPVLRPLIGTDKQEIIDEAQRLKTFEISSQSHEDCCTLFMPRHPETHAKLPHVETISATLPIETWLTQIMESLEVSDLS
ncbi:MAG: tRNA 4-thiouridine(8) synthase ThiI [Coriobacteriales bacterium]|jgi:thiamine biosynthesis protein ThiI|nr:tRNA 4-thiouridine(8) synthase ThiI [Coriobacteriales bacterium]